MKIYLQFILLVGLGVSQAGATRDDGPPPPITPLARGEHRPTTSTKQQISGVEQGLASTVAGEDPEILLSIPDSCKISVGSKAVIKVDTEAYIVTYDGGPTVKFVTDTGVEIFANRARAKFKDKNITLTGDVTIYQGDSISRAEKVSYNWGSKHLETYGISSKINGLILNSGEFVYKTDSKGRKYVEGLNASLTSEDDKTPNTWVSADRLRIYQKDSLIFSDLTLNYGGMPFFYFPYFSHSLNPKEGYTPGIGMKSIWGGFLLNSYGVLLGNRRAEKGIPTANYILTTHLDYRTRRGLGTGIDFANIKRANSMLDMTGLSLYGVYDMEPSISPTADARTNIPDKERWRIAVQDTLRLSSISNAFATWRMTANLNILSDRYMLRDYFPELYEVDSEPDNTVTISRTSKTSALQLINRFHPNDFYMTDQRTELRYDRVRSAIGRSSVVYESQTSADVMRQCMPGFMRTEFVDRLNELSPEEKAARKYYERMLVAGSFFRVHTFHELSRSFKLFNFFNVTPRVGAGYTGYYGAAGADNFDRALGFAAVDFSLKFSRHYAGAYNETLGINTLNHIIQPYSTIAYTGINSTDDILPMIDGYTPTTSPVPISVGRITALDTIESSALIRYGVRNFLMTKRDGQAHNWLSLDMFMDAYIYDAEQDRDFSNLYSAFTWQPLPWLEYGATAQFPVMGEAQEARYREYNNYVRWMPTRWCEFSLGHRYLKQHPILVDDSQIDFRTLLRINEELAVAAKFRWSITKNSMDIQEYQLYKNMGSWYFGTGAFVRNNAGKNELGFGISFTLKGSGTHLPVRVN